MNEAAIPQKVQRFNLQHRLQHGLMALSVLMLIITGFPIKYADMFWAPYVVNIFGGFENMFTTHLIFAVLMILSGLYHVAFLAYSFIRGERSLAMLPGPKDLKDAWDHARYLIGLNKDRPLFGRYSYLEKFEYFAVIWGVIVMGISGVILLFPQMFLFWPRWALDVARVVHTNEGFVCMLAIVVGHFFAAHLNPKVFPSSPVWYSGEIKLEHLQEEHPLEYKEITGQLPPQGHEHLPGTAQVLVELVVYVCIFGILLYTFVPMLFV